MTARPPSDKIRPAKEGIQEPRTGGRYPPKPPSLSAAIYARYSSDNQSETSIEDQVRVCRRYAALQGFTVVARYEDAAISGASTLRPGYQKLLEDARKGAFDIVLAEALDRLSRDLADVATLYKNLSYQGIRLWTVAEGEITELLSPSRGR